MKKKFLSCVLGAVAALSLASCGFDAASKVETFEKSIDTTVKLTYNASYDVDVTREGGINEGFNKFIHKIRATSEIEMDLGSDLYIEVTKKKQDLFIGQETTESKAVLYKKDGKYYYQTNLSAAVEVAEADAKAKVASILADYTYEDAGGITLDTLLYNNLDKTYEYNTFGLTDTFVVEDMVDPVYTKNDVNGIHVEYKPEYVGYKTDGGMSDFSNSEAGYAAVCTLDTNEKGYVTSWKEEYNNASLVFNIMTPPPVVVITGSKSFTATYGEAITKIDSVELDPSTAVYEQSNGGTFVVKTCAMGQFSNMTDVANGGALEMGKIICVKVTPAAGKEVDTVSVNGVDTPMINPAQAGGFYCFNVVPGANTIVVTYKDATPTNGVVTVTNDSNITYKLQSFTYGAAGATDYKDITDGQIIPGASIFGAIVVDSSTEVTVTVNGTATTVNIPAGNVTYYCFAVKTGGAYDVVITPKGQEVVTGTHGVVTVTNNTNVEYKLQSFTYGAAGATDYIDITDGKIVPGASIFGAIVVSASTPVQVVVNGTPTTINIPSGDIVYYCFAVKAAGNFEVVINPAA